MGTGWFSDVPLETLLAGLEVLVVDDNADTVELTAVLLGLCGASVRTARSSGEALAVLQTWRPHVLLSDLAMPAEDDGYALIASVRGASGHEGRHPGNCDHGSRRGDRSSSGVGGRVHRLHRETLRSPLFGRGAQRPRPTGGHWSEIGNGRVTGWSSRDHPASSVAHGAGGARRAIAIVSGLWGSLRS
jgi:Response regulator receiver domain